METSAEKEKNETAVSRMCPKKRKEVAAKHIGPPCKYPQKLILLIVCNFFCILLMNLITNDAAALWNALFSGDGERDLYVFLVFKYNNFLSVATLFFLVLGTISCGKINPQL